MCVCVCVCVCVYTVQTNVKNNVKDDIRKGKEKCKPDHRDQRLFLTAEIREGFMETETFLTMS